MRAVLILLLGLPAIYAQNCPPARILPVAQVSGSLDDSSCLLSDGTAYQAYRLDLPTRGQIGIDLSGTTNDLIVILRDAHGAAVDSGTGIHRPIEAGSYTLLVNGRTRGQVGGYTIQTGFTAEPGMLCTAFPSIGLNQVVAGTLGASGCWAPDGTPYEAFLLTTLGAGTLTVSVSSPDFTPVLILRSQDGYPLASDAAAVSVPVDRDSTYEVVIATADNRGAYQVTTSFQPGDSETCRAAQTFTGPGLDKGSITADSCSHTIPDSGDLAFFNYYNLTVSAAGLADLNVSSSDFIPTLYLLDQGGNLVAVDSGGAGNSQSEIRMQLQPGTYVLQVFSSVASGGAYAMTYQFTPGPPQPCLPVAINPGDAPAGTLSPASCRSSLGLADLYSLTLPASGTLDITLSSSSFSTLAAIRDAKDNLVVMNQDVQGLGLSHLTADLPGGAYTIAAAATSGAGTYLVATTFAAHDIPPCGYAQPLDLDGGYIQRLGPASCRAPNGQPMDLYQFTLPSDALVLAVLTSSELDGFLTLTDAGGNTLRSDDNSYGYDDPLIVEYLPAGTYQLAARDASATVGGYYEIDLRTAIGPRPPFCASRGAIAPGASVTGTLSFSSCQYIDATFADVYRLELPAGATIDLRLTSSAFDAFLVLLDAKGSVVDQDDDSGGGTDARLNRPLAAGTYYVVAKPMGDYTASGAYTLSLAQLQ